MPRSIHSLPGWLTEKGAPGKPDALDKAAMQQGMTAA